MIVLPSIELHDIGKQYWLGEDGHATLAETLGKVAKRAVSATARPAARQPFWALSSLSFDVQQGESVGIVGANGSGKSTLLKILSRVIDPTRGTAILRGRVASLLEVGTGFHPELSGRDNVFLSGAILGMSRTEVKKRFDEVVDFSGVEQFLETPVKRYSSGMYMRLAFAVAAHLDSEILLVDEILAVGDAKFQQKCLDRMGLVSKSGRTVLFVSHNPSAVLSICTRTLWLDRGAVVHDGPTAGVLAAYAGQGSTKLGNPGKRWGDGLGPRGDRVSLVRISLNRPDNQDDQPIDVESGFMLTFEYDSARPGARVVPSLEVRTEEGILVFDVWPTTEPPSLPAGRLRTSCLVPPNLLNAGTYLATVRLHDFDLDERILEAPSITSIVIAEPSDRRHGWLGAQDWPGVTRPKLTWTTAIADQPDSGTISAVRSRR